MSSEATPATTANELCKLSLGRLRLGRRRNFYPVIQHAGVIRGRRWCISGLFQANAPCLEQLSSIVPIDQLVVPHAVSAKDVQRTTDGDIDFS